MRVSAITSFHVRPSESICSGSCNSDCSTLFGRRRSQLTQIDRSCHIFMHASIQRGGQGGSPTAGPKERQSPHPFCTQIASLSVLSELVACSHTINSGQNGLRSRPGALGLDCACEGDRRGVCIPSRMQEGAAAVCTCACGDPIFQGSASDMYAHAVPSLFGQRCCAHGPSSSMGCCRLPRGWPCSADPPPPKRF